MTATSGVLTPSAADVSAARALEAKLRDAPRSDVGLVFNVAGKEHVLLDHAKDFFVALVNEIAQGHSVGLVDLDEELSTTEAAALLGVSRPTLVTLLKQGLIPHRMVGTHRRVPKGALLEYRKVHGAASAPEERLHAVDELLGQWHAAGEAGGS